MFSKLSTNIYEKVGQAISKLYMSVYFCEKSGYAILRFVYAGFSKNKEYPLFFQTLSFGPHVCFLDCANFKLLQFIIKSNTVCLRIDEFGYIASIYTLLFPTLNYT